MFSQELNAGSMADDESESDPGLKDDSQPSIYSEKEAPSGFVNVPVQVSFFFSDVRLSE